MLSPRTQKLQAAADYVNEQLGRRAEPASIIAGLVEHHGGKYRPGPVGCGESRLSVAGASSTCTFSRDVGLLNNWRRNATVRLMQGRG